MHKQQIGLKLQKKKHFGMLDNKSLTRRFFVSLRLFYSFVFRLVFQAQQNTAQLVKILSDTTQQNV